MSRQHPRFPNKSLLSNTYLFLLILLLVPSTASHSEPHSTWQHFPITAPFHPPPPFPKLRYIAASTSASKTHSPIPGSRNSPATQQNQRNSRCNPCTLIRASRFETGSSQISTPILEIILWCGEQEIDIQIYSLRAYLESSVPIRCPIGRVTAVYNLAIRTLRPPLLHSTLRVPKELGKSALRLTFFNPNAIHSSLLCIREYHADVEKYAWDTLPFYHFDVREALRPIFRDVVRLGAVAGDYEKRTQWTLIDDWDVGWRDGRRVMEKYLYLEDLANGEGVECEDPGLKVSEILTDGGFEVLRSCALVYLE
ncbi:uncharacterized protein BDR25DRAFT_357806 [Lindgomyces ingoldianus]|uniref:Uncharacterized protein n=1 Tax=Lindgomyces ingoldianus TaxID=673940 RepID=A0ACB6QMA9_9PLEO|nr:uncharacterized protein BDR25DRAFT_357806 [Lindgomyces ingoldianus]KAF2468046.1 hypothetical protein BDR25DRAFT_357806 [Lindgomyces ingoldianus]